MGQKFGKFIWQKDYCERSGGKHLDEEGWSSLPGSSIGKDKTGRRVPGLLWHGGVLSANANEPGNRNDNLPPRPAAVL